MLHTDAKGALIVLKSDQASVGGEKVLQQHYAEVEMRSQS